MVSLRVSPPVSPVECQVKTQATSKKAMMTQLDNIFFYPGTEDCREWVVIVKVILIAIWAIGYLTMRRK
jgi:hypothetical protein